MPSVIFICTANLFRSPISEGLFRKGIGVYGNPDDWQIQSAGTWTKNGLPLPAIARQISQQLALPGIDDHRTQQVDEKMLNQTDLILVMEANHKEALISEFPNIAPRIFLLSEVVENKKYDIPDPSQPSVSLIEVTNELSRLISTGSPRIVNLAIALAKYRNRENLES